MSFLGVQVRQNLIKLIILKESESTPISVSLQAQGQLNDNPLAIHFLIILIFASKDVEIVEVLISLKNALCRQNCS